MWSTRTLNVLFSSWARDVTPTLVVVRMTAVVAFVVSMIGVPERAPPTTACADHVPASPVPTLPDCHFTSRVTELIVAPAGIVLSKPKTP